LEEIIELLTYQRYSGLISRSACRGECPSAYVARLIIHDGMDSSYFRNNRAHYYRLVVTPALRKQSPTKFGKSSAFVVRSVLVAISCIVLA